MEYVSNEKEDYYLFLGGSLGAEKINELAKEFFEEFKIPTILVSGDSDITTNGEFKVYPFLDNQLEVMSKAKAIITRGGASTLVECEVLSKKTIVIPSPNVVADHQYFNGLEMEKKGGFKVIREEDVDAKKTFSTLESMVENSNQEKISSCKIIIEKIKEINE